MDPDLHIVQALHLPVVALDHKLHLLVACAEGVGHEMKGGLFDLDTATASIAQGEQLLVHCDRHVPDDLAVVLVLAGVDVQEQAHHLRAAGAESDGLPRLALRDAPDLRVVERPMFDLSGDARPAPGGVNLVQQRARRISEPRAPGLFRLQVVTFEASPALDRIVMPASASKVFIAVEVAVGEDIQPGAILVADDDGERVLKFLAKPDVHHVADGFEEHLLAGANREIDGLPIERVADAQPVGPGLQLARDRVSPQKRRDANPVDPDDQLTRLEIFLRCSSDGDGRREDLLESGEVVDGIIDEYRHAPRLTDRVGAIGPDLGPSWRMVT